MRELKFRAWNIIEKRWNCDDDGYWRDGDCFSDIRMVNMTFRDKDYIWEQYTGLKDRNGKEIYEGDILLIPNRADKTHGKIYTVEWHRVHARFNFANKSGEFGEISIGKIKRSAVIGNIHENPELLKGATK